METYGIISLLPVAVVIVTAMTTKRALEPLVLGALVGFAILSRERFIFSYLDALFFEISNSAYFIVVGGAFGAFIRMLEESKAITGFTRLIMGVANTKKKSVIITWLIGMVFFFDNKFSNLSAGLSNREVSDKNKLSREMFTFNINTVACSTCVLVPFSLWGVFMSGQIESALELGNGEGIKEITKAIPFMIFPIITPIIVLLFNFRMIPIFGGMKKAEKRVEQEGQVQSEFQGKSEILEQHVDGNPLSVWYFLIPMIALVATTFYFGDLLYGLLVGVIVCSIVYSVKGLLKTGEVLDIIPKGCNDMFVVIAIIISAFVLQQVSIELGLVTYLIGTLEPYLIGGLLPTISFLLLLGLGFATGSFWGMLAICFPMILPLAASLNMNMYLIIGAIISGVSAASVTCFFGDSVTLACEITKVKNIDYAKTALPLTVVPLITTTIAYLVLGYLI